MTNGIRQKTAVTAVSSLLLLLAACDSGTSYGYKSYYELKSDPGVAAATVPDFVPKSATKIFGWYHVELNEERVEFSFGANDHQSVVASFTAVPKDDNETVVKSFDRNSWKDLSRAARMSFYMRPSATYAREYLAVDGTQNRAYYWAYGHAQQKAQ